MEPELFDKVAKLGAELGKAEATLGTLAILCTMHTGADLERHVRRVLEDWYGDALPPPTPEMSPAEERALDEAVESALGLDGATP